MEDDDVASENLEEGGASYRALVDVVGPFALKEEEWAEDEGRDKEGEEGDADEAPEMREALLKQGTEACGSICLVDEERSGYEEEVEQKVERDGGMAEARCRTRDGIFVKAEVGFAEGADVEAGREPLRGQGVVEEGGELEF